MLCSRYSSSLSHLDLLRVCVVGGGHHGDVSFGEPALVLPEFSVPPVLLLLQNGDDVILSEAELSVSGSCPLTHSYGLRTHSATCHFFKPNQTGFKL